MSTPTDIRRVALNLLARREHSHSELIRKLLQRGFDEGDARTVLAVLVEENLLSDARFLVNYIHYRRSKGIGPLRIRAELIERGVTEDLIEPQLEITNTTWLEDVRQVWKKRFKSQLPDDFKKRAQQMRFLQQRGFTREQIESVFREM